jgi:hypothetical protein
VVAVSPNNTIPISAASLPLPTGAATSSNQTTLGSHTTKVNDGTNTAAVKAASTAAAATDPALVVAVSPNNTVPVNVSQVGAASVSTAASGVQKVGVVGNAGAIFDAAHGATAPANVVMVGGVGIAQGSQPTATTAGQSSRPLMSLEGVQYVAEGGSNRFSCLIQAATVTTQCQAAPAAGLRAYVTSAHFSNQTASVQTLDIVFGTGAACVTGTTAMTHKWQMGTAAVTTSPQSIDPSFTTPLVPTAANAICVRPSGATAFGATLTGYIAP